jgi:hypothetical protein
MTLACRSFDDKFVSKQFNLGRALRIGARFESKTSGTDLTPRKHDSVKYVDFGLGYRSGINPNFNEIL